MSHLGTYISSLGHESIEVKLLNEVSKVHHAHHLVIPQFSLEALWSGLEDLTSVARQGGTSILS
jgi:hypothetical protein